VVTVFLEHDITEYQYNLGVSMSKPQNKVTVALVSEITTIYQLWRILNVVGTEMACMKCDLEMTWNQAMLP
jgi:hypothetical protein